MTVEGKDGTTPVEDLKSRKPEFVMNRMQRRHLMYRTEYNNNRKPKNSGFLQMGNNWGGQRSILLSARN